MLIRKQGCAVERSAHGNPKRVILRAGELPDVTQIAEASFAEPFSMEPHVHPTMYEIYYVVEGTATYTVGSEQHEACVGDLVVVPPGTPHCITITTPPHRVFYWGIATGRP